MDRFEIGNSVTFNRINIAKFKTNLICIDFIIPLAKSTASKAALLAYTLKHGSKKYPSISEIACKAQELYGAEINVMVRKKGDNQILSFYIDYVDGQFLPNTHCITEYATELLNSIIFEPLVENNSFNEEYVKIEKGNLSDIIRARKNNKTSYAVNRCAELITKNEPHSVYVYGDIEELEKLNGETLYAFYKEFMTTANIQIFAIGNFNDNALLDLYKEKFNYKRNPSAIQNLPCKFDGNAVEFEYSQVEQAKLSIGFKYNSSGIKHSCITLFLILFAASPNSLLFMNVREKLSLCYYCSAKIERFKNYMIVYSGVLPEKLTIAKEEILRQLEIVKNGAFSSDDLSSAKSSYYNSLNSIYDNAASIEESALNNALLNKEFNIEKTKEEINSYTAEDIADAAKRMEMVITYTLCSEVNSNEQ